MSKSFNEFAVPTRAWETLAADCDQATTYKLRQVNIPIKGGAKGADELCRVEAERRGIQTCTFHANWFRYRRPAGPIRNAAQLKFGLRMAIGSKVGPVYKFKVLAYRMKFRISIEIAGARRLSPRRYRQQ